jgi:hypothetical protein
MAHTYIVAQVLQVDGQTIVNGTVDGSDVQVSFTSQIFASTAAFQAFVQPLMLAAVSLPVNSNFLGLGQPKKKGEHLCSPSGYPL